MINDLMNLKPGKTVSEQFAWPPYTYTDISDQYTGTQLATTSRSKIYI